MHLRYTATNGAALLHIGYFEPDPKLKHGGKKYRSFKRNLKFSLAVYLYQCLAKYQCLERNINRTASLSFGYFKSDP